MCNTAKAGMSLAIFVKQQLRKAAYLPTLEAKNPDLKDQLKEAVPKPLIEDAMKAVVALQEAIQEAAVALQEAVPEPPKPAKRPKVNKDYFAAFKLHST
jgi:hypothetical protein